MFSTIHTKFITPSVDIDIQALEINADHWHSTKRICSMVDELELILCKSNTFITVEHDLILFLLTINKNNPRIEKIHFYTDITPKATLVCACVSDVPTFKPENFLKRNIVIDFTKQNKRLLFTDITKSEWALVNDANATKMMLPPTWCANNILTDKYSKLKELFL